MAEQACQPTRQEEEVHDVKVGDHACVNSDGVAQPSLVEEVQRPLAPMKKVSPLKGFGPNIDGFPSEGYSLFYKVETRNCTFLLLLLLWVVITSTKEVVDVYQFTIDNCTVWLLCVCKHDSCRKVLSDFYETWGVYSVVSSSCEQHKCSPVILCSYEI